MTSSVETKLYGLTEVSLADGRKETGYEKVSFMKIPYRDDGNTVISLSAPKDYVSVTDTPVPERTPPVPVHTGAPSHPKGS